MLRRIKIMEPEAALELREKFNAVPFEDGDETAGSFVKNIKNNRQITGKNDEGKQLLVAVSRAVLNNPAIRVYAYPKQICRIMTNIHGEGEFYGKHVDNTMIGSAVTGNVTRADLSFTLFLTEPDTYEGGELAVDINGQQVLAKGNPGELILYDSGLLHEVKPVTSGMRISTVGWIQSCISEPRIREALSEMDIAVSQLSKVENVSRELQDSFHKVYNAFLRIHMN